MKFMCPRYEHHLFEYENMYISTTRRMQGIEPEQAPCVCACESVHACVCVCAEVDKIEDS